MPDAVRDDPFPAYNFLVEAEGVKGAFSEVIGLTAEIGVIEYRTGADPTNTVRKLPGLNKYPNVVFKRGITSDLSFWNWMRSGLQGQVTRSSVVITLLDEQRKSVQRWRLNRAWPCKYTGPTLNAKGSEIAIESFEIAHEGLDIEST